MTMIGTPIWGGRKTGAEITGRTHVRVERQVMDRIVETGGRNCLVVDSRNGCSRQKAALAGMPFGDRLTAARYAPVFDFRVDPLSSGRHAGSCEKAWFRGERSRRLAGVGWRGDRSDETGNGKFRNESCWHQKATHIPASGLGPRSGAFGTLRTRIRTTEIQEGQTSDPPTSRISRAVQ